MTSDQQDSVSQRIKIRRKEMGFTIRELARRTGLSASFISQVENSKTKVSLDSLRLITEHLDTPMHYFFSEPHLEESYAAAITPCDDDSDPSQTMEYSPVVRAGCRPKLFLPDSGVNYELLVKDLTRNMEPFMGRLSPGTGNVARRLRKPTEEFLFVLAGKLLVGIEENEYILNPGDSIYFEGYDLQKLACASETEDAIWISVITPPVF
ncbi:MAG: helix-turn-helix transcriptional regulator [Chloroflexi bacterium]|nr:helix-turn-helix transcriptional regulator [Chloroflexota bacterium]